MRTRQVEAANRNPNESKGIWMWTQESGLRFPVDVVDGFGRQWTASEIASSPHIIDTLDGLDGLDGPSSF
jgi:hypothetical protein